jgi:hypothetical protein
MNVCVCLLPLQVDVTGAESSVPSHDGVYTAKVTRIGTVGAPPAAVAAAAVASQQQQPFAAPQPHAGEPLMLIQLQNTRCNCR